VPGTSPILYASCVECSHKMYQIEMLDVVEFTGSAQYCMCKQ